MEARLGQGDCADTGRTGSRSAVTLTGPVVLGTLLLGAGLGLTPVSTLFIHDVVNKEDQPGSHTAGATF